MRRLRTRMTFGLILLLCATSLVRAQVSSKELTDPSLTADERKQATLLWMDKFLTDSVLMSANDTAKIRDAVAKMSPTQLEQWLKQVSELAAYVESPAWQDTKRWLREFLRVQAIYSDEQIAQMRRDVFNADADQMLAILKRIQEKHESLVWMQQASSQARAGELQQRNASVARQASAAAQSRSTSKASLPLFGTGVAKQQKPSTGYRPPGPLIDSRSVARAAVWSEVWGGSGWFGGF